MLLNSKVAEQELSALALLQPATDAALKVHLAKVFSNAPSDAHLKPWPEAVWNSLICLFDILDGGEKAQDDIRNTLHTLLDEQERSQIW